MRIIERTTAIGLTLLVALSAGCVNPALDSRVRQAEAPPDFQLVFNVQGMDEEGVDHSSQSILLPDRHLRVAVGQGADFDRSPLLTRVVLPAEYAAVWRHIDASGLLDLPSQPELLAQAVTTPPREFGSAPATQPATRLTTQPATGPITQEDQLAMESSLTYLIWIHAAGQTHPLVLTPRTSPAAQELLRMLITLRRPVGATER
ncbi:MAG: hypothetical protein WD042_13790 [Phycisphaeraceae bacterium]